MNDSKFQLEILLSYESVSKEDKSIIRKVMAGDRIDEKDGLHLYKNSDLALVGALANYIREKRHGSRTYFNRNFHIEPTNVCIYSCSFCSYSRLIKNREDGWEYTEDQIMDIVRSYDNRSVTEVHIVGGVLPQYDVGFYSRLFKKIKKHRPSLHIKALTPVEYHYIFKKEKISYEEGMRKMKEAGLDSMPGGGAEIFDREVRSKIAGDKCTTEQWLKIHEIWHKMGERSNATILYGHIESYEQRIQHMKLLRDLQQKTGGFQTYIPLKFRNKDNEMEHLPEVSVLEDLKNYAVSRIYLDNFDHIKAYWPMIGRTTAQLSLAFGVNDMDGTIDDTTKIYSMAGSEEQSPAMSTFELVKLIRDVGRTPIERDTTYNEIKNYEKVQFEEEKQFKGYVSLPVIS